MYHKKRIRCIFCRRKTVNPATDIPICSSCKGKVRVYYRNFKFKRKVILVLHKRIDGERVCICGSEMESVEGKDWCCKKQINTREPSQLFIDLSR